MPKTVLVSFGCHRGNFLCVQLEIEIKQIQWGKKIIIEHNPESNVMIIKSYNGSVSYLATQGCDLTGIKVCVYVCIHICVYIHRYVY